MIFFTNGSNAGEQDAFINNAAASRSEQGGLIELIDFSDAGSATFTNNGGTANGARGGVVQFQEFAGAENGTFINNGGIGRGALGGLTSFLQTTFANSSTLIANGGARGGMDGCIMLGGFMNGGTARVTRPSPSSRTPRRHPSRERSATCLTGPS